MCLFHVLVMQRDELALELRAVHVHHGLRTEADGDEAYVRALCDRFDVPLSVLHADVKKYASDHAIGIEEAGREIRYQAFRDELAKCSAPDEKRKIAVAHTRNDQAETVLFRMFRGTGLRGLAGIGAKNGNIIRPLLHIGKEEIVQYLSEHGIDFVTDSSNMTDEYARNRIRGHILGYAENEICEGASEHIAELADLAAEALEVLDKETDRAYQEVVANRQLRYEMLKKEPSYIQKEVVRKLLFHVSGFQKDISSKHVELVLDLFRHQVGKVLNLPYDVVARRTYEGVVIERSYGDAVLERTHEGVVIEKTGEHEIKCAPNASKITLKVLCRSDLSEGAFAQDVIPKNRYTKWLDYDKMVAPIDIRVVQSDDRIVIDRFGHSKRVLDDLKDCKIEARERKKYHVLTCDGGREIVWCIGGRMSEAYKITESTQRILEVSVMEDYYG